MGVLPQGSVAAAVDAVDLVQRTEGLRGVVSGTKICGMALDDPAPEPLWSALSGGGTPLLIPPHHGVGLDEMDGFGVADTFGSSERRLVPPENAQGMGLPVLVEEPA